MRRILILRIDIDVKWTMCIAFQCDEIDLEQGSASLLDYSAISGSQEGALGRRKQGFKEKMNY